MGEGNIVTIRTIIVAFIIRMLGGKGALSLM